ncbi:hypothetical protein [Amycolatopsis sp. lyj-112]|uniref:hypothetical protein n=1 Tax=Amycolatopsis sp. lyj-112 TaxID=2789288 RepID=UPI003978ABEE
MFARYLADYGYFALADDRGPAKHERRDGFEGGGFAVFRNEADMVDLRDRPRPCLDRVLGPERRTGPAAPNPAHIKRNRKSCPTKRGGHGAHKRQPGRWDFTDLPGDHLPLFSGQAPALTPRWIRWNQRG